jgi:hypothetical protein
VKEAWVLLMDPFVWGLLSWILSTAVGGIVSNRTDAAFIEGKKIGAQRISGLVKGIEVPENQDLQLAIYKAFTLSQIRLVEECLSELTGGTYGGVSQHIVLEPDNEQEVKWLIAELRNLKGRRNQIEQRVVHLSLPITLPDIQELTSLDTTEASFKFRDTVIDYVVRTSGSPLYKAKAVAPEKGLFEYICAFFSYEMRTNSVVQRVFQQQLLEHINSQLVSLQANIISIVDIETALRQQAHSIPHIFEEIQNLESIIRESSQNIEFLIQNFQLPPQEIIVLETFWENFSLETEPPLSPGLIIGGRFDVQEKLQRWLIGDPSKITVEGDSLQEAIAFLAAVIQNLDEKARAQNLTKAIVIDGVTSWHSLINSTEPLVLIPRIDQPEGIGRAIRNGHHVFIPSGRIGGAKDVSIPRIKRSEAEQALQQIGFNREQSSDLATLARRSLQAFRRKLNAYQDPVWAHPQEARSLLAPLLVGAWQDSSEGDRKVLERLSRLSYESLQESLVRWANEPDPPVRRVGNIWMIAAQEDAWRLIARYLTDDDLQIFETLASEVLSELDPALELPPEQRYAASIYSKVLIHSGQLREGIASTLALMATLSFDIHFAANRTGKAVVDRVVWNLFEEAKANEHLWASIAFQLPLLAEASPEIFLRAVDEGTRGDDPILVSLFQDSTSDASLMGSSPHTGLLWALETLAWNPDYLSRAVLYLARLKRLDPGGKLANRPLKSLRDIFVCWHPNTTASAEVRLEALDIVRNREPVMAWQLLMSLLPRSHSSVSPTHKTKWRDWMPDNKTPVTVQEYFEITSRILEWLTIDAGTSISRWINLIASMEDLMLQQQEFLLKKLELLSPELFPSKERANVCDCLRSKIAKHQEYQERWEELLAFWWRWYCTTLKCKPLDIEKFWLWIITLRKAAWLLTRSQVERLEMIYVNFQPQELVDKHLWLFRYGLGILGRAKYSWQERERIAKDLRSEALKEIIDAQGWDGVLKLAQQVKEPTLIGETLAKSSLLPIDINEFLKDGLGSSEPWLNQMTLRFVRINAYSKGESWSQEIISLNLKSWNSSQHVNFLLCMPFNEYLMDQVESIDENEQRIFWTSRSDIGFYDLGQTERVITPLLKFKRPDLAVSLIKQATQKCSDIVTPERIAEILEIAEQTEPLNENDIDLFAYQSAELLDHLEQSELPRERLVSLELLYVQVHEHHRRPREFYRELSGNPDFFMEALQFVFKAENESLSDEHEHKKEFANTVWNLLEDWRRMPGLQEDGSVDSQALYSWVKEVREKAKQCDLIHVADIYIGKILSFSPVDSDGIWPHKAVRDLLEKVENPDIDGGLRTQIFNNRGVTVRWPTDGGQQERILADRYLQDARHLNGRWPKIAAILRDLADDYSRQAQDYDQRAELTQDLW